MNNGGMGFHAEVTALFVVAVLVVLGPVGWIILALLIRWIIKEDR